MCLHLLTQERLTDVLARWQSYQTLLDDCGEYLSREVTPWLENETRVPASDHIAKAQQQNVAKV